MYFHIRDEGERVIVLKKVISPPKDKNLYIILKGKDAENATNWLLEGRIVFIESGKIQKGDVDKYRDVPISDTKRVQAVKAAELELNSKVQTINMIDYITYIDSNNELMESGFIITDSNREEKYLELLETNDEHLIDLLEELLIIKDRMSHAKSAKAVFDKEMDRILKASEEDM